MFRRNKDDDESTVKELAKGAAKTAAASKVIGAVTSDDEEEEKSGGKGKFVALLLAGVGALYWLKKRRETERAPSTHVGSNRAARLPASSSRGIEEGPTQGPRP